MNKVEAYAEAMLPLAQALKDMTAERDALRAEIKRLRGELADQVMGDGNTIAEQRKALEQALEALNNSGTIVFMDASKAHLRNEAITAIQGVLK